MPLSASTLYAVPPYLAITPRWRISAALYRTAASRAVKELLCRGLAAWEHTLRKGCYTLSSGLCARVCVKRPRIPHPASARAAAHRDGMHIMRTAASSYLRISRVNRRHA